MTQLPEQAKSEGTAATPFQREERYIVIKRKHLPEKDEANLRRLLSVSGIPTIECVVVESDWPEYEAVWRMIEDRVCGTPALTKCPVCGKRPASSDDGVRDWCPACSEIVDGDEALAEDHGEEGRP